MHEQSYFHKSIFASYWYVIGWHVFVYVFVNLVYETHTKKTHISTHTPPPPPSSTYLLMKATPRIEKLVQNFINFHFFFDFTCLEIVYLLLLLFSYIYIMIYTKMMTINIYTW